MAAPRKYPDEVRDRAVRLVRDLIDNGEDSITVTGACRRVGEQLGINTDTLRNWVKPALVDDGERPGLTTGDRARLVELEREVRELRRANAILKTASAESTAQRNSSAASLSAGVSKFRVLRGREFSFAAMASRSCWVR
jgi:transposase